MIIHGGEKAIVIARVFMLPILPILHSVCLAWRHTALKSISFAAYYGACGSIQVIPQYCNLLLFESSLGLCAWVETDNPLCQGIIPIVLSGPTYAFTRRMLPLQAEQTILALLDRPVKAMHAYFRYHMGLSSCMSHVALPCTRRSSVCYNLLLTYGRGRTRYTWL